MIFFLSLLQHFLCMCVYFGVCVCVSKKLSWCVMCSDRATTDDLAVCLSQQAPADEMRPAGRRCGWWFHGLFSSFFFHPPLFPLLPPSQLPPSPPYFSPHLFVLQLSVPSAPRPLADEETCRVPSDPPPAHNPPYPGRHAVCSYTSGPHRGATAFSMAVQKKHRDTHTHTLTLYSTCCTAFSTDQRLDDTPEKQHRLFFLLLQQWGKNRHRPNEFHTIVFTHSENTCAAFPWPLESLQT